MLRFVRDHREALVRVPNLFLPVSLSAHGVVDPAASEERRDRAAAAVEKSNAQFMRDTGWMLRATHPVAGALLYRQYGFPVRCDDALHLGHGRREPRTLHATTSTPTGQPSNGYAKRARRPMHWLMPEMLVDPCECRADHRIFPGSHIGRR